ncbi:MAG: zinc-binding dehydrogenase [Armatimonadota bacterium]
MRAISLRGPGQVDIVEIAEPTVGEEEVLVEVHCVGLCGSDLNAYRGTSPMVTYPRVPGHEVGGVVVGKGERVPETIPQGARVTVSPYSECGSCPACRAGRPNCCQFNQTLGVQRDGALTERIAIHHSKVFASERLTVEELALVEPLGVGYHAANRGRVVAGDTVLVLGCGTVGLGAIAAAATKGAEVIALDVDGAKLELARKLGAGHSINSEREDPIGRVGALTSREGVSVAVEAVGAAATYRLAVEAVAFAGRVVCVGYAKEDVPLPTRVFVSKELDVLGSRNSLGVFPSVIRMLEERERPFTEMITSEIPFAETGRAFAEWAAAPGEFAKILVRA